MFVSAELEILCSQSLFTVRGQISCSFSNEVTEVLCTYDDLPPEECPSFPLVFDSLEYGSDQHTLTIHATDIFNQTVDHTFTFQLDERKNIAIFESIYLMCVLCVCVHKQVVLDCLSQQVTQFLRQF